MYGSQERIPLAQTENNRGANAAATDPVRAVRPQKASCCSLVDMSYTGVQRLQKFLGVINGLAIIGAGSATVLGWLHACPTCGCDSSACATTQEDNSCCYCIITDAILPAYTIFFGAVLFFAELRLPGLHARCKNNFGFLFSLTFRVIFLLFVGSFGFAIKCDAYKWAGWGAAIFTMLNALFSCMLMNRHPVLLHLSGHEDLDRAYLYSAAATEGAADSVHTQVPLQVRLRFAVYSPLLFNYAF